MEIPFLECISLWLISHTFHSGIFWLRANSSLIGPRVISSPSWTCTEQDSSTWWRASVWRPSQKSWPTGASVNTTTTFSISRICRDYKEAMLSCSYDNNIKRLCSIASATYHIVFRISAESLWKSSEWMCQHFIIIFGGWRFIVFAVKAV